MPTTDLTSRSGNVARYRLTFWFTRLSGSDLATSRVHARRDDAGAREAKARQYMRSGLLRRVHHDGDAADIGVPHVDLHRGALPLTAAAASSTCVRSPGGVGAGSGVNHTPPASNP